jgi:hypothetical protein
MSVVAAWQTKRVAEFLLPNMTTPNHNLRWGMDPQEE